MSLNSYIQNIKFQSRIDRSQIINKDGREGDVMEHVSVK